MPNPNESTPEFRIPAAKLSADQAAVAHRIARALQAQGMAIWLKGSSSENSTMTLVHSGNFKRPEGVEVAGWQQSVSEAVARCASRREAVRVAWKESPGGAAVGLFLGIVVAEEVAGVAGFLGGPEMLTAFRDHRAILGEILSLIPLTPIQPAPRLEAMDQGLANLAEALLAASGSAATARAAANALSELLAARRVCLFERGLGRWRLVAAAGANSIDPHGAEPRDLVKRFEKSLNSEIETGWQGGALSRWHDDSAARHTGILIERGGVDLATEESILKSAAPLIAHALYSRHSWLRRRFRPPAEATPAARRKQWMGRILAIGAVGLIGFLLFLPVSQTFTGKCELLPSARGSAIVEAGGRIEEVFVTEGAVVQAGQPLARIDGSEISTRLQQAIQDMQKYEADARRLQQEGDMPAFRIAQLDQVRANETVKKLNEDLRQCQITAPLAGVVLTKDLGLRRGDVAEEGTVFCEIASLANWDLQIKIDEADAGWLEDALKERGKLPVRYVLQARSDLALGTEISSPKQISQMAYPDDHMTIVYVTVSGIQLPKPLLDHMRPGFSGLAKIEGNRGPLIGVALAKFIQFVRLRLLL